MGCRHGKQVKNPEKARFRCKKCGATAKKERKLCKPAPLEAGPRRDEPEPG